MGSIRCEVHFRDEGTFIVTYDPDPRGGVGSFFRGPIRRLEAEPTPGTLGRTVSEALDRPPPAPDFRGDPAEPAYRACGFRSWMELRRGARSFDIRDDGTQLTIHARPMDAGGGHLPHDVEDVVCARDAEGIGRTLLDLRPRCPVSNLPTPPRPGRSYRARDGAATEPSGVTLPTFGYKFRWMVVDTTDAAAVVAELELEDVRPATWAIAPYGVGGVFVSPSVLGWTFLLGQDTEPHDPEFLPFLERLSRRFGEVQYFTTHRVVDLHAWAKAVDGAMARAYAWIGERGEILIDVGELTPEERELGFDRFLDSRTVEGEWGDLTTPDEEDVMRIAGKWSLNPQELDAYDGEGPGFVGRMP